MSRPARALIDLDALRHNYRLARQRHGGRALAVVKADAYGHGAIECARALQAEADGYAVACIEEALALREAGIRAPILLLEGVFEAAELERVTTHDLWMAVHHAAQIEMIERSPQALRFHVWLKVDSGMHRAGFFPHQVRDAWQRLQAGGRCASIAFMSHFARADEPDCSATLEQIAAFDAATDGLPGARSLANSGAVLGWPAAHRDWARPGILLYGADPMPGEGHGLQPVMSLLSQVIGLREIAAGEPVGYGARFVAERPTRIGLVAMGYADGYPRIVPGGTPVIVDGVPARIIGRVSMDMITIDLTELPAAGIGSEVEFWGSRLPVNRIAEAAGTIAYELLCNVKRVRREYRGREQPA